MILLKRLYMINCLKALILLVLLIVAKTDYGTKIEEIEKIPHHDNFITTNYFNNFSVTTFDERLKQVNLNLATKADISEFTTKKNLMKN